MPLSAKMTKPVTTVSAMAISGESSAIARERSGPADQLKPHGAPRLTRGVRPSAGRSPRRHARGRRRRRQLPSRDDGDAVGDLEDLVEVLADHQDRRAGARQVDQRLADRGRGAGIDAPGRLADDEDAGLAVDLAADDEFLQVAAGERARLRVGRCPCARRNARSTRSAIGARAAEIDDAGARPARRRSRGG